MDFLKALKDFYSYIKVAVNGDSEEGNELSPQKIIMMLDNILLKGIYFRACGLQLLTQEQFNILRDLLNGLTSMTEDKMIQVHEELPGLFTILMFTEKVDKNSYLSLMYLLEP